jgi:hypothetical protein
MPNCEQCGDRGWYVSADGTANCDCETGQQLTIADLTTDGPSWELTEYTDRRSEALLNADYEMFFVN